MAKGILNEKKLKCICGNVFIVNSNRQIFCSPNCRSKEYRLKNKEFFKEKRRKEYLSNIDKEKKLNQIWKKNNVKKLKLIKLKYDLKNKEQIKARSLVSYDKKKNPHLYPNECIICGTNENIEFHHPDYNFPLSVYPMCMKHHVELHNAEVKV